MGPLTRRWGGSFQACRNLSTEHQESEEGSHGGTGKLTSAAVLGGCFVLHKGCDP
jgi:hypothetical protein